MNPATFATATDACTLTAQGSYGADRITHTLYDAAGQVFTVQKAYGTSLQQNYSSYEYTLNGKQKAVIDANGNRAELTWDGFDRQRRWIFPSPSSAGVANQGDYEEYGYDALGNRTSLRKRDGVTLSFAYDSMNRVTLKTVPMSATGAAGYTIYYGYDVYGLQTSTRFGSPTGAGISNSYDDFGRLRATTTTMDGTARTITSQYDLGGNRTHVGATSGYAMNFSFDAAGNMMSVLDGNNATVAGFTYDSAGRRQGLALGASGSSPVAYGYDGINRLTSISHTIAATPSYQAATFAYNPASQIVTRTISNDTFASNSAYNVTRGYSINGLNQYTAAGGAAFTYDANGNLTSDGTNTFVYDAENRLVSRSGGVTLSYDPNGRLWQVAASSGTTRFEYDGDNLLEEFDTAGNWMRRYAWGPAADEPLLWYESTGLPVRRFLHADNRGSIIAVVDDAGNLVAINGYDSWGIPNATNAGRFQYTGQAWLTELGMYYYKARIYSPTLGRFLQTDPIGYKDQMNLYSYAGNDPVDATDPSGESIAVIWGGPAGYNLFGHVALAATGRGVYSYGTATPRGSSTMAYLSSQAKYRDTVVVKIPTTSEQDSRAIKYFMQHYANNSNYHVTYRNCATAVIESLRAAGVSKPLLLSAIQAMTKDIGMADTTPFAARQIAEWQKGSSNTYINEHQKVPDSIKEFEPGAKAGASMKIKEYSIDSFSIIGNRAEGTRICPKGEAGPC